MANKLSVFLVAAFFAMVSCLVSFQEEAHAGILDLSDLGDSGYINGALFSRFAKTGSGTGNFDPFVRIEKDNHDVEGVEKGYNTDGTPQFNTKGGIWTHSILLREIPIVGIGGANYYELILDAAEEGSTKNTLFLNTFELYLEGAGDYDNYASDFTTLKYSFVGDPLYDSIEMDNIHGGNGIMDLYAYIPVEKFGSMTNSYFYLYSEFSQAGGSFEEWGKDPSKPIIPEPTTLLLFGLSMLGFSLTRKKQQFIN